MIIFKYMILMSHTRKRTSILNMRHHFSTAFIKNDHFQNFYQSFPLATKINIVNYFLASQSTVVRY